MTKELYSQIKEELAQEKVENVASKKATWLIFSISTKLYALPAEEIKEILRDTPIYPLPFVPEYLKGVVNRYGDPYAVVDPLLLIGSEEQTSSLFIVLNNESHTCLQITDVKNFYTASEDAVVHFAQADMSEYFEGSIMIETEQVLVLKPSAFLERVGNDLAS